MTVGARYLYLQVPMMMNFGSEQKIDVAGLRYRKDIVELCRVRSQLNGGPGVDDS